MLYYYNRDGKFQKESNIEYKTEKGATERMSKEKQGAVFDETGQMITCFAGQYDFLPERAFHTNADSSFDVQTTCDSLRIRSGSEKGCRIVGYIREKAGNKKSHTIVEEKNGWGRLASGEGWIELAFTKKAN